VAAVRRRLGRLGSAGAIAALVLAAPACSDDDGSVEAFCEEIRQVPSLESVVSRFNEVEPTNLADRITKAREAYQRMADAAPGAIDGQADAVVDLVDEVLAAVEAHPDDPEAAADAVRTAMAEHEGVADDRAELVAYAEAECGVVLDPPVADGGTTTTGPTTSDTTTATSAAVTAPEGE
jgi:hypothetical protein